MQKTCNRLRFSCAVTFLVMAAGTAIADALPADINSGGYVMMIRHAYAPGNGDPEDFAIGDCNTQRNLDGTGRAQARAIGKWLTSMGVRDVQILSSQWCRCMETAKLLGLGSVKTLPALNSFYEWPQKREPTLSALREFLSGLSRKGPLTILVTHFVTIAGITGASVGSGVGVIVDVKDDAYPVVQRLDFAGG